MTQVDLSKVTGLNQVSISKIETGATARPPLATVDRIAQRLGVTIDELVHGSEALDALALLEREKAVAKAALVKQTKDTTQAPGQIVADLDATVLIAKLDTAIDPAA